MWMCLNMSEFTITDMILNIYQTILIARSLYKLISTYWEISGISLGIYIYKHIQNPVKNLRWSALEKQLEFSTIFAKKLHFKSLRRFWICIRMQYGKVLNIPGFWVSQVSAYASVAQRSEYVWKWLNNALAGFWIYLVNVS